MKVEHLRIADVALLTPPRFSDERGFFSETFNAERLATLGIYQPFVQDNQSLSVRKGTVRGLHCQLNPHAQGKLVRCVRGAIFDVAVDARTGSETFGSHVSAVLSAENWAQLWVPPGFLHGFCTLEPQSEVIYKVTGRYERAAERGVAWDDPKLGIAWPFPPDEILLSEKDRVLPAFEAARGWFA